MAKPNTIGQIQARFVDGSVVSYRDSDPVHIRQERFKQVLEGEPVEFWLHTQDGMKFGTDLSTGELYVGEERYKPEKVPQTALRLIYYKRMYSDVGSAIDSATPTATMDFFVVGWQTTDHGKNVKVGLKVRPDTWEYELTEDI